jgi:small redox-active disulfide protein 2
MATNDIVQIRVGGTQVGIIGLTDVIADVAEDYSEKPDREVMTELLSRLSKRNFIPKSAREEYEKAFLREFRKFLGKPFENETSGGLEIKVLGPGCAQCDGLEKDLMDVMAETGIVADLEHVRDIKEIGRYGVMGTPALVINGKVMCVGSVPPRSKLAKWLREGI